MATCLSINVNKFATLRNARGGNNPNLVKISMDCERFGVQGVTVHPRPDERHITYQDVIDLSNNIKTEFNVEGYPTRRFMDLVLKVKPTQVTLVPDLPNVLTSNAGWDILKHTNFLQEVTQELNKENIRVSIFIDTNLQNIKGVAKIDCKRVEFYTEPYASNFASNKESAIAPFLLATEEAKKLGLEINAGHDLNLQNLGYFAKSIPFLEEVSIGHALISDALYYGLENTIQMYLQQLSIA